LNNPRPDPGPQSNQPADPRLSELSDQQLEQSLRALTERDRTAAQAVDRLQELVHELMVHRVELEMQNRALQETQAELEQSLQRYSDLYDHLPLGYVTVTPSGQILHANVAAADFFQQERTALAGAHLGHYLDAYDGGRLAGHLESCVRTGRAATLDIIFRLPGGSTVAVQLNSRLAPGLSVDAPQIHVAISDISKLKQTQRILEEINREQEAFNYSISHDLRAPLITINNYAGIVLSDFAAGMDEEGRAMVERIRCAGVRMEETLKHLLEYSTLAREDIALEVVNTEEVVKELLIEHRGLLQEKVAEVHVDRPIPPVRGCVPILNQVLANLLTNAVKYTREGEAPHVRIFAETRPTTVVLKVADRGIGIERKYHERIFRIFERLHGYSKYPGSGVGLAIARRAVERMQGRIWVESEPGKGSTFCMELPKA
jgi:PAS domain S-box-containing protein